MISGLIFQSSVPIQEAIAPIWLVGMAIAALAVLIGGGIIVSRKTTKVKGCKIAVLGMQGAGKTQLYNMLRGKYNCEPTTTGEEIYKEFTIKLADNREVRICKGIDIGGLESLIQKNYKKMISENEIIIFIFKINKYLNDSEERRSVNARFDFLYNEAINKGMDIDNNIVVLGSFFDKLGKLEKINAADNFRKIVNNKEYSVLFNTNVFFLNITEKGDVDDVANKIF